MIILCTDNMDFSHKLVPAEAFPSIVGAFHSCHGICWIIMGPVCVAATEVQFCHGNYEYRTMVPGWVECASLMVHSCSMKGPLGRYPVGGGL